MSFHFFFSFFESFLPGEKDFPMTKVLRYGYSSGRSQELNKNFGPAGEGLFLQGCHQEQNVVGSPCLILMPKI
jgi:hypothetical protein